MPSGVYKRQKIYEGNENQKCINDVNKINKTPRYKLMRNQKQYEINLNQRREEARDYYRNNKENCDYWRKQWYIWRKSWGGHATWENDLLLIRMDVFE